METNHESSSKEPKIEYRSQAKLWAIIGTIAYGLPAMYFTYIYMALSCMIFDTPGSESKGMIWPIIGCYSFLLPVPVPVYLMWWSYFKNRNKSKLPASLVLILYYLAVIVFGVDLLEQFLNRRMETFSDYF